MCSVESSSTLKYAERARSALNSTQLSKTQVLEAKLGRLTQLYKELQLEFQQERDNMETEKQEMMLSHKLEVQRLCQRHEHQVSELIAERNAILEAQMESIRSMQRSESVFLRATRKTTTKIESDIATELANLTSDADTIHQSLKDIATITAEGTSVHVQSMSNMVSQLSARLRSLGGLIKEHVDRSVSALQSQETAMRDFAHTEGDEMKKTAEEMIKVCALEA